MNNAVKNIEERIENAPSISSNTLKILETLSSPDCTIKDLAELVATDVFLATKCLKIVNSASYGLNKEISSIQDAISYLGLQSLTGLVVGSDLGSLYDTPLEGYNSEGADLWDHCLRTAIAAKVTANELNLDEKAGVAYTGGLLHDLGKIFISDELVHGGLNDHLDVKEGERVRDFLAVENEICSTDHADVGYLLAQKFEFPEVLKMMIKYHHEPWNCPDKYRQECELVHIGDALSMLSGFGTGYDSMAYKVDHQVLEYLDLGRNGIEKIFLLMDQEFREVKKALSEI